MSAAGSAVAAQTGSASRARAVASILPAILIGYSVLVDPLINLGPVDQLDYGGLGIQTESKSTIATKIVIPGLCFLAICLWAAVRPAPATGQRRIVLPLAAFLALAGLSSVWALDPGSSVMLTLYQSLLCITLALSLATSGDAAKIMWYLFVLFLMVIGVNLVFAVIRPPGPIGHQGIYPYKNTLGSAAACALLFTVFYVLKGSRLSRLAAIVASLGAVYLLVASESKTALALVFVAPAAATFLYLLSRGLRVRLPILVLGTGMLMLAVYLLASQLWGFGSRDLLFLLFGDETFTGRTHVWAFTASHIADRPFLGHGYRSFWGIGDASPKLTAEIEFIRMTGSSHSGFMDVLLDLGIAGFTILVVFILAVLSAIGQWARRPASRSIFYLTVVLYVLGRNAMESVILWSTFFDNLCFVLVAFLAVRTEGPVPARRPVPPVIGRDNLQPGWQPANA